MITLIGRTNVLGKPEQEFKEQGSEIESLK